MDTRDKILEYIRSKIKTSADVVFEYTGDGCSVPKDITRVRFHEGLETIEVGAFYKCKSLKSITIPHTVTEIGNYAIKKCINLKEVIFNDGLRKIGEGAFSGCKSLKSASQYHPLLLR